MLIKRLPSNICKQIWWCAIIGKGDFRNLCQKLNLHVMSNSKNRMGAQILSHYLIIVDVKVIFSLVSNLITVLFDLWPQLRLTLVSKAEVIFQRHVVFICNVLRGIRKTF